MASSNNPKVSIIIPVYNVGEFVKDCIYSVINQSYENIECLIIDDCGPDNSIQICQEIIDEYKGYKTIKIIHREKNGGLSAARNSGLDNASGDYVYYLDGDDTLFPNSILDMVSCLKVYPNCDIIIGNFYYPSNPQRYNLPFCKNVNHIKGNHIGEYLFFSNFIPTNATDKLIKIDLAKKIRFTPKLIHEDVMWMYKACQEINEIGFTNTYTYNRIENPTSIMSTTNIDKTGHHIGIIISYVLENLPKHYVNLAVFYFLMIFLMYYKNMTIDHEVNEKIMAKFISKIDDLGYKRLTTMLRIYKKLKVKPVIKAYKRVLFHHVNDLRMTNITTFNIN